MRTHTHKTETPGQGHGERNHRAVSPASQQKFASNGAFAGALAGLSLLLLLLAAVGCRTVIVNQTNVDIPERAATTLSQLTITQTMYDSDVTAEQGKDAPVRILTDPAISASQNGDANATREGASGIDPTNASE